MNKLTSCIQYVKVSKHIMSTNFLMHFNPYFIFRPFLQIVQETCFPYRIHSTNWQIQRPQFQQCTKQNKSPYLIKGHSQLKNLQRSATVPSPFKITQLASTPSSCSHQYCLPYRWPHAQEDSQKETKLPHPTNLNNIFKSNITHSHFSNPRTHTSQSHLRSLHKYRRQFN